MMQLVQQPHALDRLKVTHAQQRLQQTIIVKQLITTWPPHVNMQEKQKVMQHQLVSTRTQHAQQRQEHLTPLVMH